VANVAICAPLNPHYQQAEFSFFLQDLQANALILTDRDNSVARIAAESLGIPDLFGLSRRRRRRARSSWRGRT
jgi:hypothetical protein